MQNVEFEVTEDGKALVIRVDLTQRCGPSSSGKTQIIASTQGSVKIGSTGASFGLNVYTKDKAL